MWGRYYKNMMNNSSLGSLAKIYSFLPHKEKVRGIYAILLSVFAGIAEFFTLGAILVFLGVVIDPNNIDNSYIVNLLATSKVRESGDIILYSSLTFVVVSLISSSLRTYNIWYSGETSARIGSILSSKSLSNLINQNYETLVESKSNSSINAIVLQSTRVTQSFSSLFQLVSAVFIIIALVLGLFSVDKTISTIVFSLCTLSYAITFYFLKKRLKSNSVIIANTIDSEISLIQNIFGSIRDIFIDESQSQYVSKYYYKDIKQRSLTAKNVFFGVFPRYLLEFIAQISLVVATLIISRNTGKTSELLPQIGAFALGAQKLLPAMQQFYYSTTAINSHDKDLDSILKLLSIERRVKREYITKNMRMKKAIRMENIVYSQKNNILFENVNIEIKIGSRVGIVGDTGVGKSTFMDIIMGLRKPTSGSILIDDTVLDYDDESLIKSWKSNISHVPQSIFIEDTDFAQNIAFGISLKNQNKILIEKAAECSCLKEYIESLPKSYDTSVGENGNFLSGGQKQRLAIGRALYKERPIMFLDEATSALDSKTESKIMKMIHGLDSKVTVFMIAHRHTTLKNCDLILRIENKRIRKVSYEELKDIQANI